MRTFMLTLLITFCLPSFAYELYLVRHFEKQTNQSDPELTLQGLKRAESLVHVLTDKQLAVVYSTDYRRTQQTATPSAIANDLNVTSYDPSNLQDFAQRLKSNQQNALIVGHSNTTPELLSLLGGESKKIGEADYGELFILIMLEDKVITQSIIVSD